MTTELQQAMARYEDARIQYKKAVLASLNGAGGEGIRAAIREFQEASANLRRVTGAPPRAALEATQELWVARAPRAANTPAPDRSAGLSFFRRFLHAS